MTHHHSSPPFTIEESLVQACHLVADGNSVSAVYVVPARRPTLADIHEGCALAHESRIALTLNPDGTLVMRGEAIAEPASERRQIPHPRLPRISLGLPDLSEGTR